jgi:transcriptional regulator with XRE-family HTH domain
MQARRSELGYTSQEALAAAAGVGISTIGRLERGQRVSSVKEASVERALRWQFGSIESLFQGGEPTPLDPQPQPSEPSTDAIAEPRPEDYPDEHEYMNAVYWYLRRGMGMSHEAVMRGFNMAAAIYERKNTKRSAPKAPSNKVG